MVQSYDASMDPHSNIYFIYAADATLSMMSSQQTSLGVREFCKSSEYDLSGWERLGHVSKCPVGSRFLNVHFLNFSAYL